ncbi:MAG TPA: type VI secretion system tube protein Hcp [Polyangiales bacterium]
MAVNIHMKIKCPSLLEGESVVKGHEKEIECISYGWSMTQSATTHAGEGGGSGKVNVHDLSFVKYVDKSSGGLVKLCCAGTHINEAKLTVRKAADAKNSMPYVEIVMKNCIVTGVTTGAVGDSDRITETVTLNFAEFEYKYTPQDSKHGAGASDPAKWNIAKNCEA